MDYRNIKRAFVFNKALASFNASSSPLFGSDVFVLMAISYGYSSAIAVYDYLRSFKRSHNFQQVSGIISKLQSLGYVQREGSKWVLSLSGRNALNELERLVRECRYDK